MALGFFVLILLNFAGELSGPNPQPDSLHTESTHEKKKLRENYKRLRLLESKRGRLEKALYYFSLESAYTDMIYEDDKAEKIAEAETRYEIEEKEGVIQLLERQNEIQQLKSRALIAAFILFSIACVVIYLVQRHRSKKGRHILNLQIEHLTRQGNLLSKKIKDVVVIRNGCPVESRKQFLLKNVLELVENKLSDPLFSVEKMTVELGMSRTHIQQKIRTITGFPLAI